LKEDICFKLRVKPRHEQKNEIRGVSNYCAVQSRSPSSVNVVCLVTDPLGAEQVQTERKNVQSLPLDSSQIGVA